MMVKKYLKNTRSQAALEFLTTYAWAFLVILIMIGALAYFGILKPSKILPDRCTFGTEIGCADSRIQYGATGANDGLVNLRLKNNVGEPIVVEDMATDIIISTDSSAEISCSYNTVTGGSVSGNKLTWGTSETIDFVFNQCDTAAVGFVKGDKGKILIAIDYHLAKTSTTYTRQVAGEVFTTIT